MVNKIVFGGNSTSKVKRYKSQAYRKEYQKIPGQYWTYYEERLGEALKARGYKVVANEPLLKYAFVPDLRICDCLVIECDGHHHRTQRWTKRYDAERDRVIRRMGYRIIRFSNDRIYLELGKCCDLVEARLKQMGYGG
ncbi:endonuclease domain-containing protein [Fischerella sp. PCC 9605]|uniref:endonuclease domain-containing protein n=1 Tax=Fischerella sp. PCC 9605 TaxID=1173024 RepID=UPI00047CEE6B|nr:DUF559 domain-containing protein [Fischerella sp. PCC 9605]